MQPSHFVHLHTHSEYSLIDGLVNIPALVERAVLLGMPAVALTDQSNLFAAIKFYKAAHAAGIKPIMGADVWIKNVAQPKLPFLVTFLCQHNVGYQNLIQLISKSYVAGHHEDKPVILQDWLAQYSEGLIVLSGLSGEIGAFFQMGDSAEAKNKLTQWMHLFPNRFYLEVQRTGREGEEAYIQFAVELSEQYGVPLVATNDVRFIDSDDFEAHEARVCIHQGFHLTDKRRPRDYSEQQYFRSSAEMCTLFSDLPEAIENSVEIAKRCNTTITLGQTFLPQFSAPQGLSAESYLVAAAMEGLQARSVGIASEKQPLYQARLKSELNVINTMGFPGYFLIVADFVRWAKAHDVLVGPGRGSGPGSLVAYALGITDIDPIKHDLLFERFLNPERVSMPDFDIDFCMEGRDRVIDYVAEHYGRENVAQIITYGTMAAKAVVRDVGRVLGMRYGQVDKIAKLIPFELGITLEKALAQEESLREQYEKDDEVRTLIELALKLEGIIRNVGTHAGGLVISPSRLTHFTPLYCETQGDPWITQFDKDDVEAVGLVKFDFLGLRTLTIIDRTLKILKTSSGKSIDISTIKMDDQATFELLKKCQTTAVFQLESRGMKELVKRLQPDCFEDIVALVALFRPGPLQSGMVDDFINRKHGNASVSYLHPLLEPILKSTYGVILYQEQVMQIAQTMAGYSLGGADLLRRAMGKKKGEEMATHREIFSKGAIKRGVPEQTASRIFDLMENFADYGFNRSHSVSYALIAYQTAWLKTHYTAAFMSAVLSSDMDNTDKVVLFINECHALNLEVDPPDINKSFYQFTVKNEAHLIYGLGALKGMGEAAVDVILEARAAGDFKSLFDFCCRVDLRKVNRRVLESLIKAGAFDSVSVHRASTLLSLEKALHFAEKTQRDGASGQHDLFSVAVPETQTMAYVDVAPWSDEIRLLGEKEMLGFYLSGHPIRQYLPELKHFTSARLGELTTQQKSVIIAGFIHNIRTLQTKRGDRMAVMSLDDESGQTDIVVFSDCYSQYRDILLKDHLIVVAGDVSLDNFTNRPRVTCQQVFTMQKARELYAKHVSIHLKAQDVQSGAFLSLVRLLEAGHGQSGQCPILIDYHQPKASAQLPLGKKWRIAPSDQLLQALRGVLTDTAVEVVYEGSVD